MKRLWIALVAAVGFIVLAAGAASAQNNKPASGPATKPVAAPVPKPPPKVHVRATYNIPEGALAFHFNGGPNYPNFKSVRESSKWVAGEDWGWVGLTDDEVNVSGNTRGWPYALMENYLWTNPDLDHEITFKAKVANGEYLVWMLAGPLVREDVKVPHFLLKLNDTVVCDDACTPEQFNSEKYLFRFLWTQYSEKPHFVYDSYIAKMFPMFTTKVKVTDGELTMKVWNYLLGAMVLLPADKQAAFNEMDAYLRKACQDQFEDRMWLPPQTKPEKGTTEGDFFLYVPACGEDVTPASAPPPAERKAAKLDAAGAPGQKVTMQLCVVPFADLGKCTLELADLKGPGTIPAAAIQGFFKNYTVSGIDPKGTKGTQVLNRENYGKAEINESVLLPSLTLEMEKGITQSYWLLAQIPADAKPGTYTATFTFKPGNGQPVQVPVSLEVYPFTLEATLPVSFGMWGVGVDPPLVDAATKRRLLKERLEFLRGIGMTAIEAPAPGMKELKEGGKVDLDFEAVAPRYELAKEVGFGKMPQQAMLQANWFGMGRWIAYRMTGKRENGKWIGNAHLKVDQQPGMELKLPGFSDYFLDVTRQYKAFCDKIGLPVVMNAVDEPREKGINPWNRNFDDSVAYLKLMGQVPGVVRAMDPMGDIDHYVNKDYLPFLDYVEVLATHPWARSAKFMKETPARGKILWLYNGGMDRLGWGFYDWRAKAQGRWEWHFCFPDESSWEYYPGNDWYLPYTGYNGMGPAAPYAKHKGGMLFRSAFLTAMEGITDYTYLYTLSQAVKSAKEKGAGGKAVDDAEAFLKSIDQKVPEFPKVRGMASGASVGQGMADDAARMTESWRRAIAEHLKALKK